MAPTKEELLEDLRASEAEVRERLKDYPAEELEKGRYENGWNGRQILAHMSSIEWTYPRLLEIANQPPSAEAPGTPPTKPARGGIGSYNDRQVAKRADWTAEQLLAEFETNRQATIKAVEATDDETLAKEVTSSGGITGPLSQVLQFVAVIHIQMHLNDILNGSAG